MGLSACRHRLGNQKIAVLPFESDQQVRRLDRGLERGGQPAVPKRDHGSQPTSGAFFKACSELGIRQIFASYNNPKGNADTERVIRTIKEDLVWIREFDSVAALEAALKMWQKAYNEDFPHSSLGYMTPYEYERWFKASAA